jgi:hypothetical protein
MASDSATNIYARREPAFDWQGLCERRANRGDSHRAACEGYCLLLGVNPLSLRSHDSGMPLAPCHSRSPAIKEATPLLLVGLRHLYRLSRQRINIGGGQIIAALMATGSPAVSRLARWLLIP